MPNLVLYDAAQFFPALPVGAHRVTENLALALFEAADGDVDRRALAVNLAGRVFAFGEAWKGPVPSYPTSVLILLHLSGLPLRTPAVPP